MKTSVQAIVALLLLGLGCIIGWATSTHANPFEVAATIGALAIAGWLMLIVAYYYWAIRHYNENFGLTDHEWKLLHPELYAGDNEREKYLGLRQALLASQREATTDGAPPPETVAGVPLSAPEQNPYHSDSFGLPPGTVRGTLALTCLVLFVVVEAVNVFAPASLEHRFDELVTAFQMVLAFYFGTRAVEMLTAKGQQRDIGATAEVEPARASAPRVEAAAPAHAELPASLPTPAVPPRPETVLGTPIRASSPLPLAGDELLEAPSERPIMASQLSGTRLIHVVDDRWTSLGAVATFF